MRNVYLIKYDAFKRLLLLKEEGEQYNIIKWNFVKKQKTEKQKNRKTNNSLKKPTTFRFVFHPNK